MQTNEALINALAALNRLAGFYNWKRSSPEPGETADGWRSAEAQGLDAIDDIQAALASAPALSQPSTAVPVFTYKGHGPDELEGIMNALEGYDYGTAFYASAAPQPTEPAQPSTQAGAEIVSWQVRRSDGSPWAVWEHCTEEAYQLTLSTGRYFGHENGPFCEVRALAVAPESAATATPQPSDAPQQGVIPSDFLSHQTAWRKAIEELADKDDSGYWPHELRAFDRAYAGLAATQQPQPAEQGEDAARLDALENASATLNCSIARIHASGWYAGIGDSIGRHPTLRGALDAARAAQGQKGQT